MLPVGGCSERAWKKMVVCGRKSQMGLRKKEEGGRKKEEGGRKTTNINQSFDGPRSSVRCVQLPGKHFLKQSLNFDWDT